MVWLSRWKFRRAGALVCAALMLVFSMAAAASAVNRIQHSAALPHEHGVFSEMLLEDHHDTDHHHENLAAAGHQYEQGSDHNGDAILTADQGDAAQTQEQPPHHHGDTGASMMVLNVLPSGLLQLSEHWRSPIHARFRISVRQSLPERPPRPSSSTI